MKNSNKIAYIKIFEGVCSLMIDKYGDNPCKHCIFYNCNACEKELISARDEQSLQQIEKIISKKLLTFI